MRRFPGHGGSSSSRPRWSSPGRRLRARRPAPPAWRMDVSALLASVGVVVGAIATVGLLSGEDGCIRLDGRSSRTSLGLAWRGEAPDFQVLSIAVLGAALLHVLAIDAPPSQLFAASAHPARGALTAAGVAAALAIFAVYARASRSERSDPRAGYDMLADLFPPVLAWQRLLRHASLWLGGLAATYAASLGILAGPRASTGAGSRSPGSGRRSGSPCCSPASGSAALSSPAAGSSGSSTTALAVPRGRRRPRATARARRVPRRRRRATGRRPRLRRAASEPFEPVAIGARSQPHAGVHLDRDPGERGSSGLRAARPRGSLRRDRGCPAAPSRIPRPRDAVLEHRARARGVAAAKLSTARSRCWRGGRERRVAGSRPAHARGASSPARSRSSGSR